MSSVLFLACHAIVVCSLWEPAQTAPMIPFRSAPPSSGEALGVAGYQPFLNTLSDFKRDQNLAGRFDRPTSLLQAPHEVTGTVMKDDQHNEAVIFAWSINKLLKDPKDSPHQSLGFDTVYQWKPLAKQYRGLTGGQKGSLKDWLEKNTVIRGPDFEQEVSDLEWLILRAGSSQGIWWQGHQLASWRESKYDWKRMTAVGDLLEFDQPGQHELSKTRIEKVQKDLIPLLESGKWSRTFLDSFLSGGNGAESSQEFRVLRAIGGEDSLYDKRIAQVVNKIVSKMAEYKGDPMQLTAQRKSDLYLLGLLRGKVVKSSSDAKLNYVVAIPHYMVTVHKSFDGQDLRVSLRPDSRGRLLTQTYELGGASAEPPNAQVAKAWSSSPSPSQVPNSVSIPPRGSTGRLDDAMFPPIGSPSELAVEKYFRFKFSRIKPHKSKPKPRTTGGATSAASRAVTPWAIPVRVLQKLAEFVSR